MRLDLLLKAQKKYELSKDVIFPIKHYMESFKEKIRADYLTFVVDDTYVWSSTEWQDIDTIDSILFLIICKLYTSTDISVIPIYFAKTQLEDDLTGKVNYKSINFNKEQ